MEVLMMNDEQSGLEILSEVGEGCGYIYMERVEAMLWFQNIMRKVWKILLPGY